MPVDLEDVEREINALAKAGLVHLDHAAALNKLQDFAVAILELLSRLRAAEDEVQRLREYTARADAAITEATSMNIRDMKTVSEYSALYHQANDRLRAAEAIVRDLAAWNLGSAESDGYCAFCAVRLDGRPHAVPCPKRRAIELQRQR